MAMNISRVIESKLRFLKLTRAGKIRLAVFSDKVLYKALSLFQRTHLLTPESPFNTYFAYCVFESQRLNLPPIWDAMSEFPNFDSEGDVTLEGEIFNMKVCNDIMREFGPNKKQYTNKMADNTTNVISKHLTDEQRRNLEPIEELKKAIRSGKMNKKGLAFLRGVFVNHKPELIPIIDAYLDGEATPDDEQQTFPL